MNFGAVTLLLVGISHSIQAAPTLDSRPSWASSSETVDLTFFKDAQFRGAKQNINFPATSTKCYPLTPGASSVRVNIPTTVPTCIVLFSKALCRGTNEENIDEQFVFGENSTLGKLNDNVLSFRLCNNKDLKSSVYQHFVKNVNLGFSTEEQIIPNSETSTTITNSRPQSEVSSTTTSSSTPVEKVISPKESTLSSFIITSIKNIFRF